MPAINGYVNPEEIKVINIKEQSADERDYIAYRDPFGDFFDMAAADTLFLESWYELKGTDANFKVKVPLKGEWEQSETPWSNGGVIKNLYIPTTTQNPIYFIQWVTLFIRQPLFRIIKIISLNNLFKAQKTK